MSSENKPSENKQQQQPKPKPAAKALKEADLPPLPDYAELRIKLFEEVKQKYLEELKARPTSKISIKLADGRVLEGTSFNTTPMQIAKQIAQDKTAVIAKVNGKLWDLLRPLEEDSAVEFFSFDSDEGKKTFWHSSAHVLGQALERLYGGSLCIGPALDEGFYYDSAMEGKSVTAEDFEKLDGIMAFIAGQKQPFERVAVPKSVALEMFKYNKFKTEIIRDKVPDGDVITVYRCGPLIDLCRGPHLPNTGYVKAIKVTKNSSTNWLGKVENDSLQRVYGIAFPEKGALEEWVKWQEEAAKRDHRNIGKLQELFFFHQLSPGSCFWLPHGARIYNKLIEFLRGEYHRRGFTEVVTPNVYNSGLWETSGHWQNYSENMFKFEVEKSMYALKPMNCVSGDALVGLASHESVRLDSLKGNKREVLAYNPDMLGLVPSAMQAFQDKGEKDCITLVLEDSRKVTLTPDHRVMTIEGWREARELVKGNSRVLVGAMPPVVDWEQADYEWSAQLTGQFKLSCNTPKERARALAFMRLAGLAWMDGHISADNHSCVSLDHEFDVNAVRRDIATVTGSSASEAIFRDSKNVWQQRVPKAISSALAVLLESGRRMEVPAAWPELFTSDSFPVALLRQLLAGMFGGDGRAPQLVARDGGEWVEAYLALSKEESHLPSLKAFFETMVELMARAGVPGCTLDGPYKDQKGSGWHYLMKVPADKMPAFMHHVGYACNVSKAQRGAIVASYYTARCAQLSGGVKKMPVTPSQFAKAIGATEMMLGDHYAIPRGAAPGAWSLAVVDVCDAGKRHVFDITVDSAEESFMANGVIVHNCPGHCLMFDHKKRSYRELPIRFADFGVLHRNEFSGALTGLTRVRRFQQDDAHIFCAPEQIKSEIANALKFMQHVYGIFGFEFDLELSTRPEKYLGELSVWEKAESQLAESLNEFGKPWKLNPGDGAFYGPKIDIHITDAMKRSHQCATIQLDFQLPIRFKLEYEAGSGVSTRPVIIHRAILGSVERFTAILIEHTGGKWPFWISPRQVLVCTVSEKFNDYAEEVRQAIHDAGYYVDSDCSDRTIEKKVREGQVAQYNYILVIGQEEVNAKTVNVRTRDNVVHGVRTVPQLLQELAQLCKEYK